MRAHVGLMVLAVTSLICLVGCGGGGGDTTSLGTVSGQVVRASDGAGVSGAIVAVGGAAASTNSSGNYTVPSVPIGPQQITVTATGYIQYGGAIPVAVPAGPITVGKIILVPTLKQPPTDPGI